MTRPFRLVPLALLATLGLSGCGGLFEPRTSEISLTTTPPGARCVLDGSGGYTSQVVTPAKLKVPASAAPVEVTCGASRYRPAHARLEIENNNWMVRGGTALAGIGSDSLSLIGIDLGRDDDDRKPKTDYSVDMVPVTPRAIHLRQRDGGVDKDIGP